MNKFHDELVSIPLIRSHTRTDDIISVTDEQILLYRQSAIESAELYTGYTLSYESSETVRFPYKNSGKKHNIYYLPKHSLNETVYWSDGSQAGSSSIIKFSKKFKVPNSGYFLGVNDCCRPCGSSSDQYGLTATYKTGFKCAADVPAAIKLGLLRFIAWCIANPGDQIVTMFSGENRINSTSSYGIAGSNNTAWTSGALELWKQFNEEA